MNSNLKFKNIEKSEIISYGSDSKKEQQIQTKKNQPTSFNDKMARNI